VGSSAALNNVQSSASNVMNADRQSYLNDLMQKYQTGIGVSQGLYNGGMNAAGQLATGAMNNGQYQGQTGYNQWAGTGQIFNDMMNRYSGGSGGGSIPPYAQQPGWSPQEYRQG